MVIKHCRKQIVCGTYGMKISGKMKIYIFHRNYLRISAAGSAALYSENRPKGRFPQCDNGFFSYAAQTVGKADGCGGFSLSCRSGRYSSYKNKLSLFCRCILQKGKVYFCLIPSVLLNILFVYMSTLRNFQYMFRLCLLCNFNIR